MNLHFDDQFGAIFECEQKVWGISTFRADLNFERLAFDVFQPRT